MIRETLLGNDTCDPGSISYSHPRLYSNSSRAQCLMNIAELRNKLQVILGGELMGVDRATKTGM